MSSVTVGAVCKFHGISSDLDIKLTSGKVKDVFIVQSFFFGFKADDEAEGGRDSKKIGGAVMRGTDFYMLLVPSFYSLFLNNSYARIKMKEIQIITLDEIGENQDEYRPVIDITLKNNSFGPCGLIHTDAVFNPDFKPRRYLKQLLDPSNQKALIEHLYETWGVEDREDQNRDLLMLVSIDYESIEMKYYPIDEKGAKKGTHIVEFTR